MAARPLRCPRDRTPLVSEPHGEMTVERCPHCKGLWLDATEVDAAVEAAAEEAEAPPAPAAWERVRYLRCATCDQQMARRNYLRVSGVIVDTCPRHGTWLDAGELERIGAFLANGGQQRVERAEATLEAESEETRKDLARLERKARQARGGWGQESFDLLDFLDSLGLWRR